MESSEDASLEELWMVPFADLMTTMVILFLGFYGYAASQKKEQGLDKAMAAMQKELAPDPGVLEKIEAREAESEAARKIKQVMERQEEAKVVVTEDKMLITFAAPVLFDSGSADLGKRAAAILEPVAEALKDLPNAIVVEGHTDDRPVSRMASYKSNLELSSIRAFAVVEKLVKSGILPVRIAIRGYGENRPLEGNTTEEGRAKNRRIELYVVRK